MRRYEHFLHSYWRVVCFDRRQYHKVCGSTPWRVAQPVFLKRRVVLGEKQHSVGLSRYLKPNNDNEAEVELK